MSGTSPRKPESASKLCIKNGRGFTEGPGTLGSCEAAPSVLSRNWALLHSLPTRWVSAHGPSLGAFRVREVLSLPAAQGKPKSWERSQQQLTASVTTVSTTVYSKLRNSTTVKSYLLYGDHRPLNMIEIHSRWL